MGFKLWRLEIFHVSWILHCLFIFKKDGWVDIVLCLYVCCVHLFVCRCVHAVALPWRWEDNLECRSFLSTLSATRSLLYYPPLYMQTRWGFRDSPVSILHFTKEELGSQMCTWPHRGPRESNSGLHAYMANSLLAESSLKPKLIIRRVWDVISTAGEGGRFWKQAFPVSRSWGRPAHPPCKSSNKEGFLLEPPFRKSLAVLPLL